jgi:hypothetical protein
MPINFFTLSTTSGVAVITSFASAIEFPSAACRSMSSRRLSASASSADREWFC